MLYTYNNCTLVLAYSTCCAHAVLVLRVRKVIIDEVMGLLSEIIMMVH